MCSNRFRPGSHKYGGKTNQSFHLLRPWGKTKDIYAQIDLDLEKNKTWQKIRPGKIGSWGKCLSGALVLVPKTRFSLWYSRARAQKDSNLTWTILEGNNVMPFQVRRDRPGVGEWKRVGDITKKEIPHRGNVRDALDLQFQDTYYKISLQVGMLFAFVCLFLSLLSGSPIPRNLHTTRSGLMWFLSLGWIYPISQYPGW